MTYSSLDLLRDILAKHPDGLSIYGFGLRADEKLTENHVERFEKARTWLRRQRKIKGFNKAVGSSYRLKHIAEDEIGYSENGIFIAAAIAEGFRVQWTKASPNAWFNISKRLKVKKNEFIP